MKRLAFKFSLLGLLLCLSSYAARAERPPYSQAIKKQFALAAEGDFTLENQYGNVDIECWDQERLKLEVTIRVEASNEAQAQRFFDQIDIAIQNDSESVRARTIIDGGWNWFGDQADFSIDYRVWMPRRATLDLTNQYGDTRVCELGRDAELTISYGDLSVAGIGQQLDLDLSYGKATLGKVNSAHLDVRYATLGLDEARDISLESQYSKLRFGEAGSLRSKSRYDQFDIGRIRDFQFEGRYGNIRIEAAEKVDVYSKYTQVEVARVADKAEFDMHYGGAQLDRIEKGFSKVNLVGRYANYRVDIDEDASYELRGEGQHCRLDVPQKLEVATDRREGDSRELHGYTGVKDARSKVVVKLNYGGVSMD